MKHSFLSAFPFADTLINEWHILKTSSIHKEDKGISFFPVNCTFWS